MALGHFREEIIGNAAVRFLVNMVVALVGAAGKVGDVAFSDETNGSEASSGERKAVRRVEFFVGLVFWSVWRKKRRF